LLEKGVMAELTGKPQPQIFKTALERFEEAYTLMEKLDRNFVELIAIDASGKLHPLFAAALTKILSEHPSMEKVSMSGVRFANVAQERQASRMVPLGKDLAALMTEQREDLNIMRKQLKETIDSFRAVIPAAENGQFAALMLSGRAGFADKIQQAVDQIEIYGLRYTRGCMTTIAATMQVYPAGLEWLKNSIR